MRKLSAVSKLQVLKVISDSVTLEILNAIASSPETSATLAQKLELTRKEYYSRLATLLKSNIIKRKDGKFILTSFGKLIHQAHLKIASAAEHSWQLKVIDSIMSNNEISDSEHKDVINKLIDDPEMKELILFKWTDKMAN